MITLQTKQLVVAINHIPLLEDISLTFQSREIWGIIGPNGSGKTTLLHTLAGLLPALSGSIDINQQPLSLIPSKHRAKKIGLLLQDIDFPFPCSVLETVLLGRYPYQKNWLLDSPLDIALSKKILTKVKLDHYAYRSTTHLSGGEKRRLALATLLAQNPLIYLLDEPTNHLDIQQQIQMLNLFSEQAKKQNKIVIMVLHDLHLAKMFCEKIILLGHNKRIIWGNTQQLLTHDTLNSLFSPVELYVDSTP